MGDHFGVMGAFFLSKQYEHLKAVLTLKQRRDAELIVRSMIEGLAQLLWASADHRRALDWREFGYVHNFRQLKRNPEKGREDSQLKKDTQENLRKLGDKFYSKQAKQASADGKCLPADPYVQDWTTMSVKELLNKVQGEGLYKFYGRFSEWHYWTFAGIARALNVTNPERILYDPLSPTSNAHTLAVEFQCLFQTSEIVNQYFDLGFNSELDQLKIEHLNANKMRPPAQ